MTEADIIRIVRETIRAELAPILLARISSNESPTRSTVKMPSAATIPNLRNIQPFGFRSRAMAGIPALIIPTNGDATHLSMVGHFDESGPDVQDGESVLYGADGQVVFMKSGGTIHQGTEAAASPVVLGDVLQTFCDNLLESFLATGIVGYDSFGLPVYLAPDITTTLTAEKLNHVDNPASNFLGQKNFVDRGA